MKRIGFAIAALCTSASSQALELGPGSSLTVGPSSSSHSVFAVRYNPALADVNIRPTENWRFNYLPALTFGMELGDANNFIDEVDDLIDILDDPSSSPDSVQETLDRFNQVLETIGDDGYLKIQSSVTAPVTPFYWRPSEFSGTFFAEAELQTQIHLSVLDAPVIYDDQNTKFATASSAYIKSGIEKRLAVGYSRPLLSDVQANEWGGRLYGGIKLNLINMELSKQVIRLQAMDGKDIEDVIEEEYDHNLESTSNVGIDLGVVWVADKYRLGFTISDINSPEFDYGAIGDNCSAHLESPIQQNNCEAAAHFAQDLGEIKTHETHTRHMVGTFDASYNLAPHFQLNASFDLAAYDDMVGGENQWLHVSSSYEFATRWLPDLRVGYRENLVGSGVSSLLTGISLFDMLTFDAEMALDNIEVDGSNAPRKLAFSLSLSERF